MNQFEAHFEKVYGICLNEGMLLCSLSKKESLSSGEISELLGLTSSNASKVIRVVENKGLIRRVVGDKDRRQMYFSLTERGQSLLGGITCESIECSTLLEAVLSSQ